MEKGKLSLALLRSLERCVFFKGLQYSTGDQQPQHNHFMQSNQPLVDLNNTTLMKVHVKSDGFCSEFSCYNIAARLLLSIG